MLYRGTDNQKVCELQGSHGSDYEDCHLLGCDACASIVYTVVCLRSL
jgi:hypothetical protein